MNKKLKTLTQKYYSQKITMHVVKITSIMMSIILIPFLLGHHIGESIYRGHVSLISQLFILIFEWVEGIYYIMTVLLAIVVIYFVLGHISAMFTHYKGSILEQAEEQAREELGVGYYE